MKTSWSAFGLPNQNEEGGLIAPDYWNRLSIASPQSAQVTDSEAGDAPAGAAIIEPVSPTSFAAFTAGNIVVYRVGTGSGALAGTATAVFIDEYTTSGAFVQSIAMPIADSGSNQTLTATGTTTSEGFLALSKDGH